MRKLRTLLLAFVWAFLVVFAVHFLDFPGSVPRFKEVSGGGVLLDQVPSFTEDAIYKRLSDYGEEGRKSYTFRNVTVDMALPLSLLPFLLVLMLHAVKSFDLNPIVRVLLFSLPFAYVILDVAENAAVLILLFHYPERMHVVAGLLPYVTSIKRVASLLAIFVPLVFLGFRFVRGRFRKSYASA